MSRLRLVGGDRRFGFGVIDLPAFQKYLNFHYSVTLDLFAVEVSTNAAAGYTSGLKGRFHESEVDDDHRLNHATYRTPLFAVYGPCP